MKHNKNQNAWFFCTDLNQDLKKTTTTFKTFPNTLINTNNNKYNNQKNQMKH